MTNGSCLCGRVTYAVTGDFDDFFLCHCGRCRKDTGSAHTANLFATGASLAWLSGAESVRSFTLPGTQHARSFCVNCGSALPDIQMDGKLLVVPAGSIDGTAPMKPVAHVCLASRAAWDDALHEVPGMGGLPT